MIGRKKRAKGSVLQEVCHFVILTVWCCNMAYSAYFVKSTPRPFSVSFNTLHVPYRHVEDVHEEVKC